MSNDESQDLDWEDVAANPLAPLNTWNLFSHNTAEAIDVRDVIEEVFKALPEHIQNSVVDGGLPEAMISRDGEFVVCHIEEHLYTKYWQHKFSAYAFAESMEMAIRRLAHEGHPFANASRDDSDVHIFIRWDLRLPATCVIETVLESIRTAFDLVYQRADAFLENSDSVLVLGKDTGEGLDLLKRIASKLNELGYFTYIIKEERDKIGEAVIQKVMRYALNSKFVVVENTEPSGHLYEFPHLAKVAECVTIVLQQGGKGATWMFEDGYAKHNHWHKFEYEPDHLEVTVDAAATWAEEFVKAFGLHQLNVLPWMKP